MGHFPVRKEQKTENSADHYTIAFQIHSVQKQKYEVIKRIIDSKCEFIPMSVITLIKMFFDDFLHFLWRVKTKSFCSVPSFKSSHSCLNQRRETLGNPAVMTSLLSNIIIFSKNSNLLTVSTKQNTRTGVCTLIFRLDRLD